MQKERFYIFTYSDDLKFCFQSDAYYLAKTVPNRITLDLVNYDGDQILFSTIFNENYNTIRLTKKEFDKAVKSMDNPDALVALFCPAEEEHSKHQIEVIIAS